MVARFRSREFLSSKAGLEFRGVFLRERSTPLNPILCKTLNKTEQKKSLNFFPIKKSRRSFVMGNAALTKASGRSCVPGGGGGKASSSSSMDERIDALVLRLHEVKSSSSSSSSSFYIESRKCCHFQTMMMMMMMSLCRDIGVLVSSSSLGKTKRDEEERKKRRKRNAGERASVFLRVVSVAFSFATKACLVFCISLEITHSSFSLNTTTTNNNNNNQNENTNHKRLKR